MSDSMISTHVSASFDHKTQKRYLLFIIDKTNGGVSS